MYATNQRNWSLELYRCIGVMAPSMMVKNVSFLPSGNISATNVSSAIRELDAEKSPTNHTHTIANVTGLQAALDAKADEQANQELQINLL